jgi:hypothetical protein
MSANLNTAAKEQGGQTLADVETVEFNTLSDFQQETLKAALARGGYDLAKFGIEKEVDPIKK